MKPRPVLQGTLRIMRYNWPWYVGGILALIAGCLLISRHSKWDWLILAATLPPVYWMFASLLASYWIYDHSDLLDGNWLASYIRPGATATVLLLHAGLDDFSVLIKSRWPEVCLTVRDLYDPSLMTENSILRARKESSQPAGTEGDSGLKNLMLMPFVLHEFRQRNDRAAHLTALSKELAPGGKMVMVEHLRDGWNFLAYGPGFLHFISRREWRRNFKAAGLQLKGETRITPFVHVFELENIP